MELKLIAYPTFFNGEEQIVSLLLQQYNFTFHLRKPSANTDEYRKFLKEIPESLHAKIILHDAFELHKEFNVQGLHFSTFNRNNINAYENIPKSLSCHSVDEVAAWDGKVEDMFLSPVFPSISKQGYNTTLDKVEMEKYLSQSRKSKVFALGGIHVENISVIIEMGFDGIAVLGAVWGEQPGTYNEIKQRLNKIIKCLNQIHIV